MKIYQKREYWVLDKEDGSTRSIHSTKEKAEKAAGIKEEPKWKRYVPPKLPLPEVREYDSMEEAIEAEDVGVSLLED